MTFLHLPIQSFVRLNTRSDLSHPNAILSWNIERNCQILAKTSNISKSVKFSFLDIFVKMFLWQYLARNLCLIWETTEFRLPNSRRFERSRCLHFQTQVFLWEERTTFFLAIFNNLKVCSVLKRWRPVRFLERTIRFKLATTQPLTATSPTLRCTEKKYHSPQLRRDILKINYSHPPPPHRSSLPHQTPLGTQPLLPPHHPHLSMLFVFYLATLFYHIYVLFIINHLVLQF